jgi:serine/threonine protein kinase
MENNQTSHCPVCGEPLPENASQGLCPVCLLKAAANDTLSPTPVASRSGAPPSPSVEDLAGHFPHWEILEILGQGGMGTVYKVRQPMLDRVVAIKILPVQLAQTTGFSERFAQEARLLAKLNHPNIVNIHDFGQAGPYFYVLMEFVDGVNLRQAMEAGRFSNQQALSIVRSMCDALEYAHAEGVVHRDIKPENILLDAAGRVKLVDFGIGKLASALTPGAPYLTVTGDALGTPHYMAPEQVERAKDVDHRADIYSLGVVFYELLTGELPLGRFSAPSERGSEDPGMDPVVMKALERQRERRHQHAAEMRTEVDLAQAKPEPETPASNRRNPWVIWGVALTGAAALAFAGLVGLSKGNMYESDALNERENFASQRQSQIGEDLRILQQRIEAGIVPLHGEEERGLRQQKLAADEEISGFERERANLSRPSACWWICMAVLIIALPGGCICGWIALELIRRYRLENGFGPAMAAALLVPVVVAGLAIDMTLHGFIDHLSWKNLELIHTAARSIGVLAWLLTVVWLIATVRRWVHRQTPVPARLNRTFVLATTGLTALFLLLLIFDKIR